MDDSEEEMEMETREIGKMGLMRVFFRFPLVLLFIVFAFLFLSMLFGFFVIFMGHFSITAPLSLLPSQCKILSSSVDLRSSKVCELGLLNYKAKHVFYPYNRSKFRCRYDYYWASVFQVEYEDHSLGQTQFASAEAPNEALPLNCRPNFGTAWLTKDKFKVNETYDCWYTSGVSKVSLYRDDIFSCQAKDPSQVEMIRRYFILSAEMLHSSFMQKKGKSSYWRWETVAGVIAGFSTSIITISFVRILQHIKSLVPRTCVTRMFSWVDVVFLKRVCFLVAYFSFMGWLAIQCGKWLGLPEIYRVYNY